MPKQQQDDRGITSYMEVLKDIREGALLVELSEKITQAVVACRETGKKASLGITLSLKVQRSSKGTETIIIQPSVKATIPDFDQGTAIFFVTDDNVLVREDPRQTKLDLRPIQVLPIAKEN